MILHVEPRMGTPGKCVVLECPEMQEDPATRFGGWFCRAHNEALAQTQKEALAARSMDRDQLEASYMWGNILLTNAIADAGQLPARKAANLLAIYNDIAIEMFARGHKTRGAPK